MKKRDCKIIFTFILCVAFIVLFNLPAEAYGGNSEYVDDIEKDEVYCVQNAQNDGEEYIEILEELQTVIPEEILRELPDKFFSADTSGIAENLNVGFFVKVLAKFISASIVPVFSDFSLLAGIIILSSVARKICDTTSNAAIATACEYVAVLCTACVMMKVVMNLWDAAGVSINNLNIFMTALLPIMASLYTLGGNVMTATVNNAFMATVFTLIENICAYGMYPVLQLCFGTSLLSCMGKGVDLRGIGAFIKGTFTTILGFMMTIFALIMAYQNQLALASDNAAARTVKFAISNLVPVVGSVMGEAMRAVIGSIGTIKSTVGTISVIVVLFIVLPTVISLLMYKLVLRMASLTAQILGCTSEQLMIDEMNGLIGYVLSLVTVCSVLFIFNITLMIKSAVALNL